MQNAAIRDEVLKVDRLGRVRVPVERREALLDAFEQCGVSALEFAAHVGVNYQTFATWRQKRARQRGGEAAPSVSSPVAVPPPRTGIQWLEAICESPSLAGCGTPAAAVTDAGRPMLSIDLPGGARMDISNDAQARLAAVLLRALENGGCASC